MSAFLSQSSIRLFSRGFGLRARRFAPRPTFSNGAFVVTETAIAVDHLVMERFGIAEQGNRKVQDLSGGARRRVQVAKMFMVDVPVVFLDEFSSGMDPILKRAVSDMLREQAAGGRTIVLTTQILTEAEELCDDILIINK